MSWIYFQLRSDTQRCQLVDGSTLISSSSKPSKTVTQNQLFADALQSLVKTKPVSGQDNCEAVARVSIRIFASAADCSLPGGQRWTCACDQLMARSLRSTRNALRQACYVLNTKKDKWLVKIAKWLFYLWIVNLLLSDY